LIHPDIFLSAAHCVGIFAQGILLGGTTIDGSSSEYFPVEIEFPHPAFDPEPDTNDVMLIKIAGTAAVEPVVLNFDDTVPANGETVTLIGFGNTAEDGTFSPDLLEVQLQVVDYDTCEAAYRKIVDEQMMCSGVEYGGKDSCAGDSGGPVLTSDNVQVGVVSFGEGCGRAEYPSVNARVSFFRAWIERGICDLSSNPPESCANLQEPELLLPSSKPVPAPPTTTTPSAKPTFAPTDRPTTLSPTTEAPAPVPTDSPSVEVETPQPTMSPTTAQPVPSPTEPPVTLQPTSSPTTKAPQSAPPIDPPVQAVPDPTNTAEPTTVVDDSSPAPSFSGEPDTLASTRSAAAVCTPLPILILAVTVVCHPHFWQL
jgi:trypsin